MINLVIEEEIVKPYSNRTKKYTRSRLIETLQKWEKDNGKIPEEKDFTNKGLPYYTTYVNEFGTWNKALEAAGFETRGPNGRIGYNKYTRKQLIETLQKWEKDNCKIPTEKDFRDNPKYPSFMTYINEFSSWNSALIIAGFKPDNEASRSREAELQTISEFKTEGAIDLSGQNRRSICDGICPQGDPFDTKGSSLINVHGQWGWIFRVTIDQLVEVNYLFLRAYKDKDFTKDPVHKWRVPIDFMNNKTTVIIYKDNKYCKHNVENMKKYEI